MSDLRRTLAVMGGNQPKRHHYVPQGYLRQWTDATDRVAVRRRDKLTPFVAGVRNVALECDLHSIEVEDGLDRSLELALAEIESDLPEHMARLRQGRLPARSSKERDHFAALMALQRVRTPENLSRMQLPLRISAETGERPVSAGAMRRYLESNYLRRTPTASELDGWLTFVNFTLQDARFTKRETLDMAFRIADRNLRPLLSNMAWSVEMSTSTAFITSDRPLSIWRRHTESMDREGAGLESADEIWFALGPHHLLVLRPKRPSQRYYVGAARVAQVNLHVAAACHEMVIGRPSDKDSLTKLAMAQHRPAVHVRVGAEYVRDAAGQLTATGQEILHMYTPYDDREPLV